MIRMALKALGSVFLIFFLTFFGEAQTSEIRILHVNDFHGFAEAYRPFGSNEMLGGAAYLAGKVEEHRQKKPSLLLSAGDMIQGNNWANLFQGESTIELMNAMRFDAMVIGNHEFDFGQEVLGKRILEAKFSILGANVKGMEILKPYVLKEVNGIRIAVIGVVAEDTPITTHPKFVEGLKFLPPVEVVRGYVKDLRGRVDVVIVLSHIGFAADRELAEKVKGIDVIIGGHSHTKLKEPVKVNDTIIVQAWEHGKALGVLDLSVREGKVAQYEGYLEEIKPDSGKKDETAEAIVKKYSGRIDALLNAPIGWADVDLNGAEVRRKETNLGNLLADIMRQTAEADVAILNGGSIRTSIHKGEVKASDVYAMVPFDTYIVAISLTGEQIREALENGVSGIEREEGRFPQVSGLKFKYSPASPAGSRIREVEIGSRPLDPNETYKVATNDFLAAGGDGYKVFGEAIRSSKGFAMIGGMIKGEKVAYSDTSRWFRDIVIEYIKEEKRIAPKTEGRIVEVP